ncbi:MAG: hypothetical protein A2X49_09695 [Lentisphaerae bacterium GWF2_52_8]|nr:MAG: hypothetical protein A2X49_09695 [Lentisphaerae bacterium GWF2_52_8]
MKSKAIFIQSAIVLLAALIASALIYGLLQGEQKFKDMALEKKIAKAKKIEDALMNGKDHISEKRFEYARRAIANLDEKDLNTEQKRRYLLIIGDINVLRCQNAKEPEIRQFYLDMATKFFAQAAAISGSKEEKNEIIRRNAILFLDHKDWARALSSFREAESYQILPEDRWKILLQEAQCLSQLHRNYEQLQVLSQVADESDDRDIWAQATLSKASLLVSACLDPEIMKTITAPKETLSAKELTTKFKKEAEEAYLKIIKDMPAVNDFSATAEVGLLRLAIMDKNRIRAYEIGNKIQESGGAMKEKAESILLLGKLEEDSGNVLVAIRTLELCMKRYPKTTLRLDVLTSLYRLYTKNEAWEKAFNTLEDLFVHEPDEKTISGLMKQLSSDSKIVEVLAASDAKADYDRRLEYMLAYLRKSHPIIWRNIENDAYLLYARLLFLCGNYERAEKELEMCLNTPKNTEAQIETIYYLDMSSAVKGKKDPVVCITRARRYLNSFPKGAHYQEALMNLLDSYYKMGLFEAAISISRKIYVDDLSKDNLYAQNPFWIKTVARIGQCYQKLGENEKSNKILRANNSLFLDKPYAGEVFLSWSRDAEAANQLSEAIRRIELVLPSVVDTDTRAELYVAQYLLKLKNDGIRDFNDARLLLSKIGASKSLAEEKKRVLRRQLYEGLLEYAFANSPEHINGLLDELVPEFKDQNWPEIWILKSLSRMFGHTELETLGKKHKETLENVYKDKNTETVKFIREQVKLINSVVEIENTVKKLKTERGL